MPRFNVVAWRVGFFCTECMGPVPLNALAPRALCSHCQSTLDLGEQLAWLTKVFVSWGPPAIWPPGKLRSSQNIDGMRVEADVRVAACRSCKADLEWQDVTAAVQNGNPVACRGCREPMAVRLADEFLMTMAPSARLILGEMGASAGATAPQAVLCACLQCGGSLKVDGTNRLVTCTYCQSANFIADALWLRMHPAHKKQWIYLSA